jgi:hypothetical protein
VARGIGYLVSDDELFLFGDESGVSLADLSGE